jgi:hypothetical protein
MRTDGRADRLIDRQTETTKLTIAFRKYANAPKKVTSIVEPKYMDASAV